MNLFTITIPDSAAALLVTYGAGAVIRIQSCPTQAGIYGNVTTVPIVTGVSTYAVYDENGSPSDWYKIRYEAADGDPAGSYSAEFQPVASDNLYASLADFKVYVRDSGIAPGDDTIMLVALDAAARAIDRSCGRSFAVAGTTATDRYFSAYRTLKTVNGCDTYSYVVDIDDVVDTTGLTVKTDQTGNGDFTASAITTYRIGPANAASRAMPYTRLVFNSGTYVPLTQDGIKVSALWGWSAVPTTIVNATLLQAARFLKRRESPFGIAGSPEMGNELRLLARLDPDVAVMVAAYKRNWGAV